MAQRGTRQPKDKFFIQHEDFAAAAAAAAAAAVVLLDFFVLYEVAFLSSAGKVIVFCVALFFASPFSKQQNPYTCSAFFRICNGIGVRCL